MGSSGPFGHKLSGHSNRRVSVHFTRRSWEAPSREIISYPRATRDARGGSSPGPAAEVARTGTRATSADRGRRPSAEVARTGTRANSTLWAASGAPCGSLRGPLRSPHGRSRVHCRPLRSPGAPESLPNARDEPVEHQGCGAAGASALKDPS